MSWIELPRNQRKLDVHRLKTLIMTEQMDRFWYSKDQDGIDTQLMRIKLPVGEDALYDITMMTAQLYAARLAAEEMGQLPGERLAITQQLLSRMDMVTQELFVVDNEHPDGIGLFIVLNSDGLTHELIDEILLDFINNDSIPLKMRAINPATLVERLMKVREERKHDFYPL